MANFNKVILLGNLTRDVEMRYTQGGTAIGKTGMAINRKFNKEGETKEQTCFVDLTVWGRQAEVLSQYTSKGSQLFIEGRLEFSSWEDKNGGGKRSKLEVVVENFQFVGARGAGQSGGEQSAGGQSAGGQSAGGAPPQQSGQAAGGEEAAADFDGIPF